MQRGRAGFTARDLFGFDPRRGAPPIGAEVPDVCSSCGGAAGQRSQDCEKCGAPISVLSAFRALSNALIHTSFARRVGLRLDAEYKHCVRCVRAFRPYKQPADVSARPAPPLRAHTSPAS